MVRKVQVIIFSIVEGKIRVLLFRRPDYTVWQPITGGVEEGESFEAGARREAMEESGLSSPVRIIPDFYNFTFTNPPQHSRPGEVTEHVYGYEAAPDFLPVISDEHEELRWFDIEDAFPLLPTKEQQISLKKLQEVLTKNI